MTTNPGEGLLPCAGYPVPETVSTREAALHCFACGGALTHSCNCERVTLHKDALRSLIYWVQSDTAQAIVSQPLLSGDCNILSNTKDICPRHGHSHAPLLSGDDGELVAKAKALLDAGVSPYPWKTNGAGLVTRDGEYLSEGMQAWSCPRGAELRDRDVKLAALAPELAEALLALNAENDALSSRCGMLEGENANLKSNLKSASEWLIKLVGEEPFRAALNADGEKL